MERRFEMSTCWLGVSPVLLVISRRLELEKRYGFNVRDVIADEKLNQWQDFYKVEAIDATFTGCKLELNMKSNKISWIRRTRESISFYKRSRTIRCSLRKLDESLEMSKRDTRVNQLRATVLTVYSPNPAQGGACKSSLLTTQGYNKIAALTLAHEKLLKKHADKSSLQ